MANVKVPALLHKMSKAAQKAWYKKNNMTMPSEVEGGGRSAAAAKRVVAPAPRKQMAAAPQSVRAMNTARQQAYYAKGGRQPIGAGGSGGSSSMAGVGQSSAKEIIKGIKAGYNPRVSLNPYEGMTAKEKKAMKKEEAEQIDEVTKKEAEETLGGPVKTKPKMPPGKQPEGYRYVRALARRAMKAGLKKEEVEQVDEAKKPTVGSDESHQQRSLHAYAKEFDAIAAQALEDAAKATNKNMLNHANISAKRAKEAAAMLRSGKSKVHALKHYQQGTLQKEEVEQIDEIDYKKYLKVSQEKRPLKLRAVDDAIAADKAGDPNPLRKLRNTNLARHFAQKQLTKKFNASRPARPFHVYEPGRRYVGDGVEHDGPIIDEAGYQVIGTTKDKETFRSKVHPKKAEALSTHYKMAKSRKYKDIKLVKVQEEAEQVDEARRMSAAEKLGRAFDSEQQRSALSRQRGLDLLKQKDTEKMQNKLASGKMSPSEVMTKLKKEETEESTMKYIEEKLTAADPASKWISDFVKSDNPKFAGKSKKERIQQALGAYYAKKRGTNEEVEQVDELRASTYDSASNKRQAQAGTAAKVGAKHASGVLQDKSDKLAYAAAMAGQKEFLKTLSPATKRVMSKEEIEQVDELKKSTLASYVGKAAGRLAAASRLQRDFEKDGHTALAGEFEKSAQKKKVGIQKAANKLAKEEVEQMDEVNARNSFVATQQALTPRAKDVKASVGTTRRDAAVTNKYARRISKLSGGDYSKQDVKGNLKSLAKEEAEQIDELKASTLGSYIAKSSADEKSRREKGVAVSKELSAKTGMKFGTPFDPKIHSKNASRSANRAVAIKKLTGQAKVNANEAAEGKVAVTPKEKSLAAHHGDKTKITFGDVLKARLKSAAAKKMGK